MTSKEKFEKWCGNTSWTPYQKSIMFLAWEEQQKEVEELNTSLDKVAEEYQKLEDKYYRLKYDKTRDEVLNSASSPYDFSSKAEIKEVNNGET